jgi:hypothetical protein
MEYPLGPDQLKVMLDPWLNMAPLDGALNVGAGGGVSRMNVLIVAQFPHCPALSFAWAVQ